MSLEHINRETDKHGDNKAKNTNNVDYLKRIAKQKEAEQQYTQSIQKEAEMKKSTSEDRTAEEQQQRDLNESRQIQQNNTNRASQRRAIFGLNFLRDMKGVSDEITGAYDPKQELWGVQGPDQRDLLPKTSKTTSKTTHGPKSQDTRNDYTSD